MTNTNCPAVNKEILVNAGLFVVEPPFLMPTEGVYWGNSKQGEARRFEPGVFQGLDTGWSELRSTQCRWDMLVFDSIDCQSCELQWESISGFQREKFGSQAKLEFVMVFGADRLNTKVIEAVRGRNGVSFMFDSRGHLEQQLAVQATPFVALVGPDGYVRGYFPGLVNVDAPGFEVLSHIFAGASAEPENSHFPNGLLVISALLIMALIGALVHAVVRIR
jgi:thioredoxin-related protein